MCPNTLASMTPWEIAERFGCSYSGDMNALDHGGYFYETQNWAEYGYASVVEFWRVAEDEAIVVSCGTINRPSDPSEMNSALSGLGFDIESEVADADHLIHIEIEACRYYCGIEPSEDFSGELSMTFPDGTDEDVIWSQVSNWLAQLGN